MAPSVSNAQLASDFASFFTSKISRIRGDLNNVPSGDQFPEIFNHTSSLLMVLFHPVRLNNVLCYIRELKKTFVFLIQCVCLQCYLLMERQQTSFIKSLINVLESIFVQSEKQALLCLHLKKIKLDSQNTSNYHPISNISFLSEIMEQLFPLFERNGVIPLVQLAYRNYHLTETTLCKIYNDLVINTCTGKSFLLVLLDLSSTFDTVDHRMLLGDLQSFSVQDIARSLSSSLPYLVVFSTLQLASWALLLCSLECSRDQSWDSLQFIPVVLYLFQRP